MTVQTATKLNIHGGAGRGDWEGSNSQNYPSSRHQARHKTLPDPCPAQQVTFDSVTNLQQTHPVCNGA